MSKLKPVLITLTLYFSITLIRCAQAYTAWKKSQNREFVIDLVPLTANYAGWAFAFFGAVICQLIKEILDLKQRIKELEGKNSSVQAKDVE
jgi:hypothetical protein